MFGPQSDREEKQGKSKSNGSNCSDIQRILRARVRRRLRQTACTEKTERQEPADTASGRLWRVMPARQPQRIPFGVAGLVVRAEAGGYAEQIRSFPPLPSFPCIQFARSARHAVGWRATSAKQPQENPTAASKQTHRLSRRTRRGDSVTAVQRWPTCTARRRRAARPRPRCRSTRPGSCGRRGRVAPLRARPLPSSPEGDCR